jgi:hypothetical protein
VISAGIAEPARRTRHIALPTVFYVCIPSRPQQMVKDGLANPVPAYGSAEFARAIALCTECSSFRQGLPESRCHGWHSRAVWGVFKLTIPRIVGRFYFPVNWIPAIPAGMTVFIYSAIALVRKVNNLKMISTSLGDFHRIETWLKIAKTNRLRYLPAYRIMQQTALSYQFRRIHVSAIENHFVLQ